MIRILTMLFLLLTSTIHAAPIHNIVVFGDSLSDNGNLYAHMNRQFPSDPYFEGRFSNGKVWIELLAEQYFSDDPLGHLLDYAFGGAGVLSEEDDDPELEQFTLRREVDHYFMDHHDMADPNSLYVFWIGSNNYLAAAEDDDKEATLSKVISGIKRDVQRLIDKGAEHVLLVSLPDLGMTPAAADSNMWRNWHLYSVAHNAELYQYLQELKGAYPEKQWLYFDVYALFTEALMNPEKHGFSSDKLLSTCYDSEDDALPESSTIEPLTDKHTCNGYLFFDPVHPTALVHKMLAERAQLLLDSQGIEFYA